MVTTYEVVQFDSMLQYNVTLLTEVVLLVKVVGMEVSYAEPGMNK